MKPEPIQSPADWRGTDIAARTDWIHRLSAAETGELIDAVRATRDLAIGDIERDSFPLPRLAEVAARALDALEHGPGMFLLRGLPCDRLSLEDMRRAYWGLGKYLGTAVSQSLKGDVIGDVCDVGVNRDRIGRGYQNAKGQPFHTDSCDVVGLLVYRTARSGGLSKIASSVAVHNEMLQTRPDLLPLLYEPFTLYCSDREGDGCWRQPLYSMHQGHFSCKEVGLYVNLAQQRFPGLPRITPLQTEALALHRLIPEEPGFHLAMMFEPGDLQLLNNHVTLHGRTGFEDHDEPGRKRHLLRLWLSVPNSRPLSPLMAEFFRDARPGALRGGFPAPGKIAFESLVE